MRKPKGYHSYERCLKAAKKYTYLIDFREKEEIAYQTMQKRGFLQRLIKEAKLKRLQLPFGHWTKEKCTRTAQKYSTRKEFRIKNSSAYQAAVRHGWIKEICIHMVPPNNRFKRALYAYEYSDKSVYVGLTHNYRERHLAHQRANGLAHKRKKYKETYVKFNKWYPYNIIGEKEIQLIENYRKKGWKILNKAKGGALGSHYVKYSDDDLKKEAKKYKHKKRFEEGSYGAYQAAYKRGLLEYICKHMKRLNSKGIPISK